MRPASEAPVASVLDMEVKVIVRPAQTIEHKDRDDSEGGQDILDWKGYLERTV